MRGVAGMVDFVLLHVLTQRLLSESKHKDCQYLAAKGSNRRLSRRGGIPFIYQQRVTLWHWTKEHM